MPERQSSPGVAISKDLPRARPLCYWCVVSAVLPVLSCAGPQSLSTAIRPEDEQAYVQRLTAEGFNGRAAFLKWMADEQKQDVAALEKRDSEISTTQNPFDAYKQPVAVSRGAVIFKFHCACCHGEDARGKGPLILPDHPPNNLHGFAHRFASTLHRGAPRRWFRSISQGYGDIVNYPDGPTPAMPAFAEKLTREQIWLVITYLQSLDMHASKNSQSSGGTSSPHGGAT